MTKPTIIDEYMNEYIFYGGFCLPRWRVLIDLRENGARNVDENYTMMNSKVVPRNKVGDYPLGLEDFNEIDGE